MKTKLILILGLMAFLANGDTYAVSSLMNNIAGDMGILPTEAALSVTAYMLSFGFFTLFFGPLSDRFGKAKIINIAAIGTSIFSILGGFAWDLPSLVFFRAVNGMFGAGILPVTMSLIGDTFEAKDRQGALAKVMGLAFLGSATATAIGGGIAFIGSWRFVYIIYGALELLLGIVMLKMLPKDAPKAKSLNILGFYKDAFKNKNLLLVVATLFFVGFAVLGSFSYSGMLFEQKTGFNTFIVGLMLSSFGIGTVLGGKFIPKIKAKFPKSALIIAGVIGFTAYLLVAMLNNIVLMMLGLMLFGMAFIMVQSTLVANSQERLPQMKGTAMSLASFFMFIGGAIGTQVNSLVITNVSISQVFINSAILFVIVAFLANKFVKNRI